MLKVGHTVTSFDALEDHLNKMQKDAVKAVFDAIGRHEHQILVELTTGSGKNAIVQTIVQLLLEEEDSINHILVLTNGRAALEQLAQAFQAAELPYTVRLESQLKYDITLMTQRSFLREVSESVLDEYNYIICVDANSLQSSRYIDVFGMSDAAIIGFSDAFQEASNQPHWFSDVKPVYTNVNRRPPFRFTELAALEFLVDLLQFHGVTDLEKAPRLMLEEQRRVFRPDLVVHKQEQVFVMEVKLYRSLHISNALLEQAALQLIRYQKPIESAYANHKGSLQPQLYLVVFCLADPAFKARCLHEYHIHILDVANLLYLSQGDPALYKRLTQFLPYPVNQIPDAKPDSPLCDVLESGLEEPESLETESTPHSLIERLKQCKPGKNDKASRQYEQLCTEIIHYLFTPEFSKEVQQHKTADKLFRMDLLCALKGTTAFWKFLIRFYDSNFVVFEYKNYGSKLSQNLIYITEKYLFDAALRNVAFILSRKGFDSGARTAAMGCLKEHKKLIIDLTDQDLIQMIQIKQDGEEPSDYLLSKVEDYLMSIGK